MTNPNPTQHLSDADLAIAFLDAQDALQNGQQAYSENAQQYGSECALYGDAWAGAAIDLAESRAAIARDEKELDALRKLAPWTQFAKLTPEQAYWGWTYREDAYRA